MTIVVDASAIVDLVCGFDPGNRVDRVLDEEGLAFAPAHVDAEVLSALGRLHRAGKLIDPPGRVTQVARFGVRRLPLPFLLPLAWSLVDSVAVKDALYIALARTLDASLLTTDKRLARACEGLVRLA